MTDLKLLVTSSYLERSVALAFELEKEKKKKKKVKKIIDVAFPKPRASSHIFVPIKHMEMLRVTFLTRKESPAPDGGQGWTEPCVLSHS